MHLHSGPPDHHLQVADQVKEFVLVGRDRADVELTAQPATLFVQSDAVAPLRGDPGRLQPGHPAPDHHHPPGVVGGSDLDLTLAAHQGIDQAGGGVALAQFGQTALMTGGAEGDPLHVPRPGLARPVGVGQKGPAQPDKVGLVPLQHLLRPVGPADAARHTDRYRDHGPNLGRKGRQVGLGGSRRVEAEGN